MKVDENGNGKRSRVTRLPQIRNFSVGKRVFCLWRIQFFSFFYITHVAFDLFQIICYGYSLRHYNIRQIDKLMLTPCMISLYYTVSCNEGIFDERHRFFQFN